jgi:hypothetical protein
METEDPAVAEEVAGPRKVTEFRLQSASSSSPTEVSAPSRNKKTASGKTADGIYEITRFAQSAQYF